MIWLNVHFYSKYMKIQNKSAGHKDVSNKTRETWMCKNLSDIKGAIQNGDKEMFLLRQAKVNLISKQELFVLKTTDVYLLRSPDMNQVILQTSVKYDFNRVARVDYLVHTFSGEKVVQPQWRAFRLSEQSCLSRIINCPIRPKTLNR